MSRDCWYTENPRRPSKATSRASPSDRAEGLTVQRHPRGTRRQSSVFLRSSIWPTQRHNGQLSWCREQSRVALSEATHVMGAQLDPGLRNEPQAQLHRAILLLSPPFPPQLVNQSSRPRQRPDRWPAICIASCKSQNVGRGHSGNLTGSR